MCHVPPPLHPLCPLPSFPSASSRGRPAAPGRGSSDHASTSLRASWHSGATSTRDPWSRSGPVPQAASGPAPGPAGSSAEGTAEPPGVAWPSFQHLCCRTFHPGAWASPQAQRALLKQLLPWRPQLWWLIQPRGLPVTSLYKKRHHVLQKCHLPSPPPLSRPSRVFPGPAPPRVAPGGLVRPSARVARSILCGPPGPRVRGDAANLSPAPAGCSRGGQGGLPGPWRLPAVVSPPSPWESGSAPS